MRSTGGPSSSMVTSVTTISETARSASAPSSASRLASATRRSRSERASRAARRPLYRGTRIVDADRRSFLHPLAGQAKLPLRFAPGPRGPEQSHGGTDQRTPEEGHHRSALPFDHDVGEIVVVTHSLRPPKRWLVCYAADTLHRRAPERRFVIEARATATGLPPSTRRSVVPRSTHASRR
jgi:hypothetical protein